MTAPLTIDVHGPTEAKRVVRVNVELVDADGFPRVGYDAAGALIDAVAAWTDAEGHLELDLVPNADINPPDLCYLVETGDKKHLIQKGAGAETLEEALVESPTTSSSPVHGVPAGGTTGQVFTKASDADYDGDWEDATGGGSGTVESVNGDPGPAVVLDAGDVGADPAGAASTVGTALTTHAALTTAAHGGVVSSADARLSDARTPTAHAASHQDGGSDELALDGSQITTGTVVEARIDAAIARDSEVTSAISTHAGAADPHGDRAFATAAVAALSTVYQPVDADLTAIALLSTTAFGRAVLALADAAALRAAAGLVIGTDVQAQDADLAAIALLATQAYGRALLTMSDSSSLRTIAGLVIGTDVQAQNANLAAVAGLTTAADRLAYWTGSGAASLTTLSAFIRTLLDDADAATARATLGLGSLATASTIVSADITDGTIVNADIAGAAAIALSKLATDPLARANHTGTQLAATISDFAAAAYAAAQSVNTQSGTTYTTVLGDAGKMVESTNGSASTFTIPANSSVAYPVGTRIDFVQMGAGQLTIAVTTDTFNGTPGKKLRALYSGATAYKRASTEWVLFGDLTS